MWFIYRVIYLMIINNYTLPNTYANAFYIYYYAPLTNLHPYTSCHSPILSFFPIVFVSYSPTLQLIIHHSHYHHINIIVIYGLRHILMITSISQYISLFLLLVKILSVFILIELNALMLLNALPGFFFFFFDFPILHHLCAIVTSESHCRISISPEGFSLIKLMVQFIAKTLAMS
jgi:hypothetical protein